MNHSIMVYVSDFGNYTIPSKIVESTVWETKSEWSDEGQCFVEHTDPAPVSKAPQNRVFFDWLEAEEALHGPRELRQCIT